MSPRWSLYDKNVKFHIHRPKIWKFCNFSYVYVHNSKTIWPTDLILVLYQRQFCVLYDHLAKPLIYLSFILKLMQKLRFYPKFDVLSPRKCRGRGSNMNFFEKKLYHNDFYIHPQLFWTFQLIPKKICIFGTA